MQKWTTPWIRITPDLVYPPHFVSIKIPRPRSSNRLSRKFPYAAMNGSEFYFIFLLFLSLHTALAQVPHSDRLDLRVVQAAVVGGKPGKVYTPGIIRYICKFAGTHSEVDRVRADDATRTRPTLSVNELCAIRSSRMYGCEKIDHSEDVVCMKNLFEDGEERKKYCQSVEVWPPHTGTTA